MINKLADLAQKAEPAFWLPGHPTDTLRSTTGDGVLNCLVRHGPGWTHPLVTQLIKNTKNDPEDFLRAVSQINSSGDLLSHGYPP